jgi:uncharacterized membrane protein
MPQERTRKIVIAGVLSAISVFLSVTPLGFIPWAGASLTIIHIPVILGAVLEGPVVGLVIGFIFGVSSMLRAAIAPNSPLDPAFTNPLISVLPRLFIGPVAWLVWNALKRWPAAGLIGAGIAGSLTNTVLVLGMIGLVPSALGILRELTASADVPAITLLGGIALANGVPEAIASAILVLLVAAAWWGIRAGRRQKSSV